MRTIGVAHITDGICENEGFDGRDWELGISIDFFELFLNYFEFFVNSVERPPIVSPRGLHLSKFIQIFLTSYPLVSYNKLPPPPPYVYYKILTQMVKEMEGFLLTQESCIIIISTGL